MWKGHETVRFVRIFFGLGGMQFVEGFCGFKFVSFAVSEEIMGVLPQDALSPKFYGFL